MTAQPHRQFPANPISGRPTIWRSPTGAPCAWCESDAGVEADPEDSHSICPRHKDEVLAPIRARRAARIADSGLKPAVAGHPDGSNAGSSDSGAAGTASQGGTK